MCIPSLLITWDYDSAIGQVNASYPYNFHEQTLLQKIENIGRILDACHGFGTPNDIRMCGIRGRARAVSVSRT